MPQYTFPVVDKQDFETPYVVPRYISRRKKNRFEWLDNHKHKRLIIALLIISTILVISALYLFVFNKFILRGAI